MFSLICLFFPTFISLSIIKKRKSYSYSELIFKYPVYNVIINFALFIVIRIYIKGDIITNSIFNNLNFCIKYLLLSVIISLSLPYIIEFICKNIEFKIEVRKRENEK